ncbi:MAG: type I 3-dehydroquinate dehydratase [Chloroflexota bacterium]|nr:type I 3-dehydroquinate dehydratase [Chloroflexota bacterium]
MKRRSICASITTPDPRAIKEIEPMVDLFEVRIDLIGDGWPQVVKQLEKPWIACNRTAAEGGRWSKEEPERLAELLKAAKLGASIVDLELDTPNLRELVALVKEKAECLLSFHDLRGTPSLDSMKEIVRRQLAAGADICKVVTTARSFADNLAVLQLIADFPQTRVVAFAMGTLGITSRVLSPLMGGQFTYAAIAQDKESAPGQLTVSDLNQIYRLMEAQ